MTTGVDFAEAEALLREAEFLDCLPIWYSSNNVYLAHARARGEDFSVVYKPKKGERALWDFPDGSLYRHEAAAYELARLVGWPLVPPTVIRDGPEGTGSVQLFIPHDPEQHFFVQREVPALTPQLKRICAFDVIANNADRKGGHCLIDDMDRIWCIDHGLCFHAQPKLRSVIWDWAGEEIPAADLADIARAGEAIAAAAEESEALRQHLHPHETTAMVHRVERLLQERRFPQPGEARHYPWPLV